MQDNNYGVLSFSDRMPIHHLGCPQERKRVIRVSNKNKKREEDERDDKEKEGKGTGFQRKRLDSDQLDLELRVSDSESENEGTSLTVYYRKIMHLLEELIIWITQD